MRCPAPVQLSWRYAGSESCGEGKRRRTLMAISGPAEASSTLIPGQRNVCRMGAFAAFTEAGI